MDRKKIEHVFRWSDEYIKNTPEILEKSTNEIFNELDDGTSEMRRLRWGVMVRANMKNLTDFSYSGIIEYLPDMGDNSLMAEYTGYVLQTQYGIRMVRLLIEGHNRHRNMFSYTSANILYDEILDIDDLASVLNVFEENKDNPLLECAVRNYAGLIIKHGKEEDVLNGYLLSGTEIYSSLILQIGRKLVYERVEQADRMLLLLFRQNNRLCSFSALDLLELLSYGRTEYTDKYMEDCICLMKNDEYKLRLIRIFANYLGCGESGKYDSEIYQYLTEIIKGSAEAKKVFLHHMEYRTDFNDRTSSLIQRIIDAPFQKDAEILHSLDFYFSERVKEDKDAALEQLEKIHTINHYNLGDMFWNSLSLTCSELRDDQAGVCRSCFDKIWKGSIQELLWGLDLFESLVSLAGAESWFENNTYDDEQMILILQGIIYFSIDAEKICEFLFLMIPHFDRVERVWNLICEDIYPNYAGNLVKAATKYRQGFHEKQTGIACRLLQMNEEHSDRVKRSYENKDLWPSARREYEYRRFLMERNKRMNEESKQKSVFAKLFPDRFMKYGKRIAYVEYGLKGEMTYKVSEYAEIKISRELPRAFLNNPYELNRKRKKYLIRRCGNEADY